MNNMSKNFTNEDGTQETVVIKSSDNYSLNMNETYRLANKTEEKQSRLAKKFKNSILGTDIGVKSAGFSNIAILATVIAVGALLVMYFMWRF